MSQGPEQRLPVSPDITPGRTIDMAQALSGWYLPESTFVDTATVLDSEKVTANYTVRDYHCGEKPRRLLQGQKSFEDGTILNTVIVNEDHTLGHFRQDKPLRQDASGQTLAPQLFPAYMGMGMIMEGIELLDLVGFRFATFKSPATPGDILTARIKAAGPDDTGVGIRVDADVVNGSKTHTMLRRALFAPAAQPSETSSVFANHQLFEVAAQFAAGTVFLQQGQLQEGKVPAYVSIGSTRLSQRTIRSGDVLSGVAKINDLTSDYGIFDVSVQTQDKEVMFARNVTLAFLPYEQVLAAIQGQTAA